MIGIDCLLKNTLAEKELRKLVQRLAYDKASRGEDASLTSVFNEINKAKIEVSLRAIGQFYTDAAFPADGPFTTHAEVDSITVRRHTNTLRNMLLMKPKEGEKIMGKESLGEHIGGVLADTLYNNSVEDHTTKSVMVKLRDTVMAATKRLAGELPNKGEAATKETFLDTVGRYINQERNDGYNTLEGKMNNIHDVMRETIQELNRYEEGLSDDPVKQEQFREYIKEIEDSLNSVLFSRADAKNVLDGALAEAGYTKTLKDGTVVRDWDKLIGEVHDVRQLRTNVRDAMEKAGYDPQTASRIADSLQKEYHELIGKELSYADQKFKNMEASLKAGKGSKPRVEVNEMINKRVAEWENFKKLADDDTKRIAFGRKEVKDLLTAALKTEGYGKELPGGKVVLDLTKLSREAKTDDIIRNKVLDMLSKQGHDGVVAEKIADAIQSMYGEMRQEIIDHANNKLTAMQDAIGAPRTAPASDLARLAELHDLGLFNGTYEALLNDRLGIDKASQADIAKLKDIGQKAADLTIELDGQNYLASYAFSNFQRQIEHILADNRANRTAMLKTTKLISDMFSVINVGILANPYNLAENNWSGYQAIISKNQEVMKQMGKEGVGGDGELWRAIIKDVAMGGVEYGDAGDKLSHTADFSKTLNTLDFTKNPGRALGTLAVMTSRVGLNGADAANKAVLHKKSMMLALHQGLVQGAGYTKEQATHFLHEALYGSSFEKEKVRAGDMLTRYGLKNTEAARIRLANDLVLGNLKTETYITNEMIEAARNSGFEVAAIALGHTANNQVSKTLQAGKTKANNAVNEYMKKGKYWQAASAQFSSNLFFNGILKFVGGGTNWAMLRFQNMGAGLVTGYLGDFNKDLDFTDKKSLEESMTSRLKANRKIASSYTEMVVASLAFSALYAYGLSQEQEEGESVMESAVRNIAAGYAGDRFVKKIAPNMTQLYYLAEKSKGKGSAAAFDAASNYAKTILNIGSEFTVQGRIGKISKNVIKGEKGYQQSMGDLGAIVGDMVNTPFYRSAKNFYKIGNYWATGKPIESTYVQPMSIWDGFFGGALLEDLGVYERSAAIEVMPGVGNKMGEEFRKIGVAKIEDLADHPGWHKKISKKSREKAIKYYESVTESKVDVDE